MRQRPGKAGDDCRQAGPKGAELDAERNKWVPAPNDNRQHADNAVTGVFLDSNERVEWVYSIMPDGNRVVTGYDIRPILSPNRPGGSKNE